MRRELLTWGVIAAFVVIAFGGVVVMFLAGVRLWLFVGAGVAAAAAMPLAWTLMHEYQRKRVLIFLDPATDPKGAGYHITQSKIAIGSGGLTGKGFLNGTQSHLDYLPELQTDFIFATMAEEWGLIGGLFVILGFAFAEGGSAMRKGIGIVFGLAIAFTATTFVSTFFNLTAGAAF